MRLENKVAFLTGGAGGMGTAQARLFAKEGAAVIIADLADEKGEKLADEIRSEGGSAMYVHLDVTDEASWQTAERIVREKYGKLDILINNAGINKCTIIPLETKENWEKVMSINVTGTMLGIKTMCHLMRESGGGSIINLASTTGSNGHWVAAYSTSKWAIRGLTRSAALTLADWNIRCNAISPGVINTGLVNNTPETEELFLKNTSMHREGEPEEVAYTALFLASDESSYSTGTEIYVDGGFEGTSSYGNIGRHNGVIKSLLEQAEKQGLQKV